MSEQRVEPHAVVLLVEQFVTSALNDAEAYENREVLDDSGVYDLHMLAAKIYALGWNDGEMSATQRDQSARARERDARRKAEKAALSA